MYLSKVMQEMKITLPFGSFSQLSSSGKEQNYYDLKLWLSNQHQVSLVINRIESLQFNVLPRCKIGSSFNTYYKDFQLYSKVFFLVGQFDDAEFGKSNFLFDLEYYYYYY